MSMSGPPLVVVVGADGFIGGALADALRAQRIVYGECRNGDVNIRHAAELMNKADVVINAGGFRVRPGCTYTDYQRCHQGATSAFVSCLQEGARLIHISSASILGKSQNKALGNDAPPDPMSFPSSAYALAKIEAEQYLEKAAAEHGFRLILIRPAVVYAPQGAGMMQTLLRLADRGIGLRLYPAGARHHLCSMNLLIDVVRRIVDRESLRHLSCFIVADPYTITNREIESLLRQRLPRRNITLPIPVAWMSAIFQHSFHSRNPKLDCKTWGEIFGVLNLDTAYDPSETFRVLGIDPSRYSREKTLQPLILESLSQ
jgi:nucleoside-diphosphate-sugar epimerase